MGAGGALGSRAGVGRDIVVVTSRARGSRILARRDATDAIKGQRRGAAQAGRAAGAGCSRTDVARLINVPALVCEWALAVQGAALASDELARLFLGHVLAAVLLLVVTLLVILLVILLVVLRLVLRLMLRLRLLVLVLVLLLVLGHISQDIYVGDKC